MPTDILSAEQTAEIAETARVAGNTEMNDHLTDATLRRKCAEHIPALLASHAALAERVAALEDAERIACVSGQRIVNEAHQMLDELDAWDSAMELILGPRRHEWKTKENLRTLLGYWKEERDAAIDAARKETP